MTARKVQPFRASVSHFDSPLCCDICGREDVALVRFQLVVNGRVGGERTTRSAGAIDICATCHRGLRSRGRPRRRVLAAEACAIRQDAALGMPIRALMAKYERGFGTIQRLVAA